MLKLSVKIKIGVVLFIVFFFSFSVDSMAQNIDTKDNISLWVGDSRTVDLHVQRLRKKLHWEDKLKAVYKVGYRLEI